MKFVARLSLKGSFIKWEIIKWELEMKIYADDVTSEAMERRRKIFRSTVGIYKHMYVRVCMTVKINITAPQMSPARALARTTTTSGG